MIWVGIVIAGTVTPQATLPKKDLTNNNPAPLIEVPSLVENYPRGAVAGEPNLTRTMYPFEINMINYSTIYNALKGLNDTNIRIAYYNASYQWVLVPFQIDERGYPLTWQGGGTAMNQGLFWSWPTPIGATLTPTRSFIPYGDPYGYGNKTWFNKTVVPSNLIGHICDNDQLVFYAYNGRKVSSTLWWNNTCYPNRIEVQIQDPVDGGQSWMYIYYNNAVSYEPIKSTPWYTSYVDWNSTTMKVTTPIYSLGLNGTDPDIQNHLGINQGTADGQNIINQVGKQTAWVYVSASGFSTYFGFLREGYWAGGDNFSRPGALNDPRTAIHDPSRGTSGNLAEGNLRNMPSNTNDIEGAGGHQAIVNGPIRVILGKSNFQYYKFQLGSTTLGAGVIITSYGYGQSYFYYNMKQTDNETTSVPYNADATITLVCTFQSVAQFNNANRAQLQVNAGAELNNPNIGFFGSSRIISTIPNGNLVGDGYGGAGDPTAQPNSIPGTGWSPNNPAIPDWVFVNSTTHGGFWMLIPRTALGQLSPGSTNWYWHDTAGSSELGLALGNIAGGASTASYYMRTIYGEFKNVQNMTALGSLLYQQTFQQLTGISSFNEQYCPPSQPIFQSITPSSVVFKDGQQVSLAIQCDQAGYDLAGDFSAIDSGYIPANVAWTDNGGGSYTMTYAITSGNTKPDGVYRIIVNATNSSTSTTSSDNSTQLQLYNNVAVINIITTAGTPTSVSPGATNIPVNVSIQNTGGGNLNITAIHWKLSISGTDTTSNYTITSGPNPQLPYTLINGGPAVWFNYTMSISETPLNGLTTIDATVDGLDLVLLTPIHNLTGAAIKDTWTVESVLLPSITTPSDIPYEIGTTGHQISWTITQGSGTYVIYRNGASQQSGVWTNGDIKQINVDSLGVGNYNYTIVATNLGGSSQDECDVTVFNTPPSIASPPPDVNYNYEQTGNKITWTISDISTSSPTFTVYQNGTPVNNSLWISGAGIVQGIDGLSIGVYNYTIIAFDGYGANVQDMVIVSVANDQPTINTPPDQNWVYGTSPHMISWTVTDGASGTTSYTVYRNGSFPVSGAWTSTIGFNVNITGTPYGIWNYTIIATDGLGGSCSDMVLVTVTNDQPAIDSPSDINYQLGVIGNTITWTVTDGTNATTSYTIYRNMVVNKTGSWISGAPFVVSVDGLSSGTYNFTCIAMDGLGGICSDTVWVTVSSNPAPTISSPTDILFQDGAMGYKISWNVTDPVINSPTYIIYRNGSNVQNGAWVSGVLVNITLDGLSPGCYNYTMVANDGYGLVSQDTVIVIVNDTPQVTQPGDANYVYGTPGNTISWIITDGVNSTPAFTVYCNDSPVQNGVWSNNSAIIIPVDDLAVGTWNYTIIATDGLGGSCSDMVLVTVTNDQPTINTPPDQNWVYGTSPHIISWTVTDGASGTTSYTVYRNGSFPVSGTWTSTIGFNVNITGTPYGTWNCTIIATDGLGGSCSDMVLVTVTNDQPSINSPGDQNWAFGTSPHTISWTVTDGASGTTSYTVYQNGSVYESSDWVSMIAFEVDIAGTATGAWNFTVIATDGYGGIVSDEVIVIVTGIMDFVDPTVTVTSPTTNFVFNESTVIEVTGYANGTGSNLILSVNGSGFIFSSDPSGTLEGAYVIRNNTILSEGYYVLHIIVTDSVMRTAWVEISFFVDLAAPSISGLSELITNLIARYDQDMVITINVSDVVEVSNVLLYYQVTGSTSIFQLMMDHSSLTYTGMIPAQEYGKTIYFRMEAMDGEGHIASTSWYNIIVRDFTKPLITGVTFSPDSAAIKEGDVVSASVTTSDGDFASGIRSVTIYYSTDDWATSTRLKLIQSTDGTFKCTLPSVVANKIVKIKVEVEDMAGNIEIANSQYTVGAKPLDLIEILLSPFFIAFVGIFAAFVILMKRRSRASEVHRFLSEDKK